MSYKFHTEKILEVRKTKYDDLWHVVYRLKGEPQPTYDRVSEEEAMEVLKKHLTKKKRSDTVSETV